MPSRLRLFYSLLMVALLIIPALTILRELFRPSDIWWTPPGDGLVPSGE